jgi:amicyanin
MKNNKGTLIGIAAIVLVAIIALAGINAAKSKPTAPTTAATSSSEVSAAVATNSVSIKNYMFMPMSIKVKVGSTVTWTNEDSVHHNVVATTASADAPNGPLIGQGQTYSFKFTKAGTYSLYCQVHPYMHSTVIVTD